MDLDTLYKNIHDTDNPDAKTLVALFLKETTDAKMKTYNTDANVAYFTDVWDELKKQNLGKLSVRFVRKLMKIQKNDPMKNKIMVEFANNEQTTSNLIFLKKYNEATVDEIIQMYTNEDKRDSLKTQINAMLDVPAKKRPRKTTKIDLQLGDIVELVLVSTEEPQQVYYIDYISSSSMRLIDVETNETKFFSIKNGAIGNGNIREIILLDRAESPSYAVQQSLVPGTYISIDANGTNIEGKITNLDNDMIEITVLASNKTIYVDFAYEGIPNDSPIKSITIIPPPAEQSIQKTPPNEVEPEAPAEETRTEGEINLRKIIVQADQIEFGDAVGFVDETIEVGIGRQRFSIEEQTSDLLDDLLSTVPINERTTRRLNAIHRMIERYVQLRTQFSVVDEYGNVVSIAKYATEHPMISWSTQMTHSLPWIIPVVRETKKIYLTEEIEEQENSEIYIESTPIETRFSAIYSEYQENQRSGEINNYAECYRKVNELLTPFVVADETPQIVANISANANIDALVDNDGSMQSIVNHSDNLISCKFRTATYIQGMEKLVTTQPSYDKLYTTREYFTENDILPITSFITLPYPIIRYSAKGLPGVLLLDTVSFSDYFYPFMFFHKNLPYSHLFIESLGRPLHSDVSKFGERVNKYQLNIQPPANKSPLEIYKSFVKSIVPSIKSIFYITRQYAKAYSIYHLAREMVPYMVYSANLTAFEYGDMDKHLNYSIGAFKRRLKSVERFFAEITQIRSPSQNVAPLVRWINSEMQSVLDAGYQLTVSSDLSDYIVSQIIRTDAMTLYTAIVAQQTAHLHYSSRLIDNSDKIMETQTNSDKCVPKIVAKVYPNREAMEADNGNSKITFDPKYDSTDYSVLTKPKKKGGYAELQGIHSPTELIEIIYSDKLRSGLNAAEARYLAETIVYGTKRVIDGQYALVYEGEWNYYIRKNNQWISSNEVSSDIVSTESQVICDLLPDCAALQDNCSTIEKGREEIRKQTMQAILSEFDQLYIQSVEDINHQTKTAVENAIERISILREISLSRERYYDLTRSSMRVSEDSEAVQIKSPYLPVLQLILGQEDVVLQASNLSMFIKKFTRSPITDVLPGKTESPHWLYCTSTNQPILPLFRKQLAYALLQSPDAYMSTLEDIKRTNGDLSDDGNWWTDKYSGWPICPGDFDTSEGYTEDGFKIVSRAILEQDAGANLLMSQLVDTSQAVTLSPTAVKIINVVNALSSAMGIFVDHQREFILNTVIAMIERKVSTETEWNKQVDLQAKKNISLPPFATYYNLSLLTYTLGVFLIAVQTSVPPIRTRKTHPGCVRSFSGYPMDGQGDDSSVTYLGCVVADIKTSAEPWSAFKRSKTENIIKRIKLGISDILSENINEVQMKFDAKNAYLAEHGTDAADNGLHEIEQWSNFLPPLQKFKVHDIEAFPDKYYADLDSAIRTGSTKQTKMIDLLADKQFQLGLAIQTLIQDVVRTQPPVMFTANSEAYLENACCQEIHTRDPLQYFISRKPEIEKYDKLIRRIDTYRDTIVAISKATLFQSTVDTKNRYPDFENVTNETTIYRGFIVYCRFTVPSLPPEGYRALCKEKPANYHALGKMHIDEQISWLKQEGYNYKPEDFLRLLQLVGVSRSVHVSIDDDPISVSEQIAQGIRRQEMFRYEIPNLLVKMKQQLDTNNTALINFLMVQNNEHKQRLISFLQRHVSERSARKIKLVIDNLNNWSIRDMPTIYRFYHNMIRLFSQKIPSIVTNSINYGTIQVPRHYKFSDNHVAKLKDVLSSMFGNIQKSYGLPYLNNLIKPIQQISETINNLASLIYSEFNEATIRELYQFYLITIWALYMNLAVHAELPQGTSLQKTRSMVETVRVEQSDTTINASRGDSIFTRVSKKQTNRDAVEKQTALLIETMIMLFHEDKTTIDMSYEEIKERTFKLQQREKNMVTNRLSEMTESERDVDYIMKSTKQGIYGTGHQRGLMQYDKEFYDNEQTLRDNLERMDRLIEKSHDRIGIYELMEQQQADRDIEREQYDISHLDEDYYDGNIDEPGE